MRQLLNWLQQAANRLAGWFRRPSPLANDWADKNAAEFTEAAIAAHPRRLGRTLGRLACLRSRLLWSAPTRAIIL